MFSKDLRKHLKYYAFDLALIWTVFLFYLYAPYYSTALKTETYFILFFAALGYSILHLAYILLPYRKEVRESRGWITLSVFEKLIERRGIEKHEKTLVLFMLVKFFFLPIMINFTIENYYAFQAQAASLGTSPGESGAAFFLDIIYPLSLPLIFLIDTAYFSFGYSFEADSLKNRVRSVEPTLLGWTVTLMCYPPFNTITANLFGWYSDDMVQFQGQGSTFLARLAVLLLLLVYLWATLALGTKCSNLTNRGIVDGGPYRYVRHPAYAAKVLMWWLTMLPALSISAFVGMMGWSILYFLRAVTEERHLIKDPDYKRYCGKVKYRFVPRIW